MKRVNIYLKKDEKILVKKTCQKYQLSITTLADHISQVMVKYMTGENKLKAITEYLYKIDHKAEKTSIKPRNWDFMNHPQIWFTNMLKIYIKKDWQKINDEKDKISKMTSELDEELRNTFDPFYNYNQLLRTTRRMLKENPNLLEDDRHGKN